MVADWQPTVEIEGKLMNLHDAVKFTLNKGKVLRYERKGECTYTAILRNPESDPTVDEIVEEIIRLVRGVDKQIKTIMRRN